MSRSYSQRDARRQPTISQNRPTGPSSAPKPGSPADRLWEALRKSGVGPVTTSKLLARKRPKLLPVIDSVVKEVLNHPTNANFWLTLHAHLRADGGRLHENLLAIRQVAGLSDKISAIRCFDVVVWMVGKRDWAGDTGPWAG